MFSLLFSAFLFFLIHSLLLGLLLVFFGSFSNLYFLGFGRLASKSFACCLESRIWDLAIWVPLLHYCASSFLQLRETPSQKGLFHCWKNIILKNSINCLKTFQCQCLYIFSICCPIFYPYLPSFMTMYGSTWHVYYMHSFFLVCKVEEGFCFIFCALIHFLDK